MLLAIEINDVLKNVAPAARANAFSAKGEGERDLTQEAMRVWWRSIDWRVVQKRFDTLPQGVRTRLAGSKFGGLSKTEL